MAIQPSNYSLTQFQENIAQNPELKHQLHSYITIDLEKIASDAAFYENLWSIAAIVGVVAATILATGAIVAVAVLNPEIIFVAIAVAASVITPLISWILETTNKHSQFYGQNATIANRQLEIANELLELEDEEFMERLQTVNEAGDFNPNRDAAIVDKMKLMDGTEQGYRANTMALAAYEYWKEFADQISNQNEADRVLAKETQHSIDNPQFVNIPPEEIAQQEREVFEALHRVYMREEQLIAPAKIQAAFYRYILENPMNDENGDGSFTEWNLEDFGKIKTMSVTQRTLINWSQNRNPIFIKPDGTEIDRSFVFDKNPKQIAKAIFNT